MKFIPILFSTPMIQAILEGRKTMTRRVAAIPNYDDFGTNIMDWGLSEHPYQKGGEWFYRTQTDVDDSRTVHLKCKYQIGDILWIRETLTSTALGGAIYKAGGKVTMSRELEENEYIDFETFSRVRKSIPSIHMPKAACRIFLEVTDVRVERLQDITEEDSIAEGVGYDGSGYDKKHTGSFASLQPSSKFKKIWESINGPESWERNDWVFVVSFKRIDKPENF